PPGHPGAGGAERRARAGAGGRGAGGGGRQAGRPPRSRAPGMSGSPVTVILLSGFLGAGKTTTMLRAARRLERRGARPVVVTNDQGEGLVDTAAARDSGVRGGAVTGGCFCRRLDAVVGATVRLL